MKQKMIIGLCSLLITLSIVTNSASLTLEKQQKYNKQLLKAAQNGDAEKVAWLLQAGAHKDIVGSYNNRPLHLALLTGHVNVAQLLIASRANTNAINRDHWTPLHAAAFYAPSEVIRLLIENHANIEALSKDKWTPLYIAIQRSEAKVVRLLIEKRAHINAHDATNNTPLHLAVQQKKADELNDDNEIVRLLIENHANVEAVDQNDWKPLHFAVHNGCEAIVAMLLNAGAHKAVRNNEGRTPLHIAIKQRRSKAIITLLLEGNVYSECDEDESENTPLSLALLPLLEQNNNPTHALSVIRLLLVAGDGMLEYAARSRGYLRRYDFNQNAFESTLKRSKDLLEKHCQELYSILLDQGIPYILANIIGEYHKSLDIRVFLFIKARTYEDLIGQGI